MQAEIQRKKEEQASLKQTFNSRTEELDHIDQQMEQVTDRFHQVTGELEDIGEVIHREREDLMDRIRELTNEVRLKHLIIDQFIPAQEYMKIERRAEWADDLDNWTIPNLEFTGNNMKLQKAKMKEGKLPTNEFYEQVLNMGEESEDEDIEASATNRVNEAITSILDDEEAETGVQQFVPAENASVFYRYTEEGAVREDPEHEKKQEKQRKRRNQSAKRPLTAKKKKTDMVTGDIQSMVKTMSAQ